MGWTDECRTLGSLTLSLGHTFVIFWITLPTPFEKKKPQKIRWSRNAHLGGCGSLFNFLSSRIWSNQRFCNVRGGTLSPNCTGSMVQPRGHCWCSNRPLESNRLIVGGSLSCGALKESSPHHDTPREALWCIHSTVQFKYNRCHDKTRPASFSSKHNNNLSGQIFSLLDYVSRRPAKNCDRKNEIDSRIRWRESIRTFPKICPFPQF